jgi:hypothetical protein
MGESNPRLHVHSVFCCHYTTTTIEIWGVRRDSNSQRQESQSWALPIELRTPLFLQNTFCMLCRNNTCFHKHRFPMLPFIALGSLKSTRLSQRGQFILLYRWPSTGFCTGQKKRALVLPEALCVYSELVFCFRLYSSSTKGDRRFEAIITTQFWTDGVHAKPLLAQLASKMSQRVLHLIKSLNVVERLRQLSFYLC